jgi:hypothetical protein
MTNEPTILQYADLDKLDDDALTAKARQINNWLMLGRKRNLAVYRQMARDIKAIQDVRRVAALATREVRIGRGL